MSTNGHGGDDHLPGGRGTEEDRRMKFKNVGKTKEELRRRRVEDNVELRKAKREDTMMKRRNVDMDSLVSSPESPGHEIIAQPHLNAAAEVAAAAEGLNSTEETKIFNNLQRLRKILSREAHPPIDLVIKAGLLARMVALLEHPDEKMQFEAAWAITNVASGTSVHTEAVIEAGAVQILLRLLASSSSAEVAEQALWGLGNVVGDGPRNRDAVLNAGIVPVILTHLSNPGIPRSFVKNIAWMVSNLTRGKNPPPDFAVVGHFLPALSKLLDSKDMDTVVDSAWSLSYLSDGPNDQIDAVIASGVVPKIIRILANSTDIRPLTPCVRIIGNIVTGSDAQTDACLNANALEAVIPLLDSTRGGVVKEVCWLLSNVAAGTHAQIQKVIDSGCLPKIVTIMRHGEFRCQKEAAWVVTNILAGGTSQQLLAMCQMEVISPLCDLLKSQEPKFVAVILDALMTLLTSAKKHDYLERVTNAVEECGGLDILESMQNHDNQEIYEKVYHIIETFFAEGDDEADTAGGDVANNGQFTF